MPQIFVFALILEDNSASCCVELRRLEDFNWVKINFHRGDFKIAPQIVTIYRKIFLRDHFPHISQILEGIHFGANTCRACIRTRANTGKKLLANYLCIGFVPGGIPARMV